MLSRRISMTDRILAIFLSMALILGMIPFHVSAETTDHEGKYTITVKDDQGTVVEGASVTYQVTDQDGTPLGGSIEETDGQGIVAIDLSEEPQPTDETVFSIGYKITKEGYFDAEGTVENITAVAGNQDVQLIERKSFLVFFDGTEVTVTEPKSKNGTVTKTDDVQGNKKIVATPAPGYRVEVVRTGESVDKLVKETVEVKNDEGYTVDLTANTSACYEITFGLNEYSIHVTEPVNGQVTVDPEVVEHGSSAKVTIKPDSGYMVDDAKVGAESVTVLEDGETLYFNIENVKAEKTVTVTFKEAYPAAWEEVTFSAGEELVKTDDVNKVYVYKKGSIVTFAPKDSAAGIRLYDVDGELIGGGYATEQVKISESTDIGKIQLYYGRAWHTVESVSNENPLKIIIDETAPTVTLNHNPESPNEKGYYTTNIEVTFSASDEDSGIEKIEYWIVKDGVEALRETINDGAGVFTLVAKEYNSDNVKIYAQAYDLAGNASEIVSSTFNIYAGTPKVEVSLSGTSVEGAVAESGYYNDTGVVTLIYEEDERIPVEEADVISSVVIRRDGQEVVIPEDSDSISVEQNADGKQIATISFKEEGEYTVESGSYINGVGVTGEITVPTDGFIIDKTVPTGTIRISEDDFWTTLLETLTFGIYKNEEIEIIAESTDTDVNSILYYKVSKPSGVLDEVALKNLYRTDKTQFVTEPITVNQNEKFVVYARIADKAGNVTYISTDGVIYDDVAPNAPVIELPQNGEENGPNDEGYYTDDVPVTLSATDNGDADIVSGISYIEYWIGNSGKKVTYIPDGSGNSAFPIDAEENNQNGVVVYAQAFDRAGNPSEVSSETLNIYYGNPTGTVSVDGNSLEGADAAYYYEKATVTITYQDRYTVEKADVIAGVDIKKDGKPVTLTDQNISLEGNVAVITFAEEGTYTIEGVSYTNEAGAAGEFTEIPKGFTIDRTAPTASIALVDEQGTADTKNIWSELPKPAVSFNVWKDGTVTVQVVDEKDAVAGVKSITYYKSTDTTGLSLEDLKQKGFEESENIQVTDEESFIVYACITDRAGNKTYIGTGGIIYDKTAPTITMDTGKSVYNQKDDFVSIGVTVTEEKPYSGIKNAVYWIGSAEDRAQKSVTLWDFEVENPVYDDLIYNWDTGKKPIQIDTTEYNRSDVVVWVAVKDNAGNEIIESTSLDIDITPPEIEVKYDDTKADYGDKYFHNTRTATVTITERTNHFDAQKATYGTPDGKIVGIKITAKDATGHEFSNAYTISQWKTKKGETPDEDTHTATIQFTKDANYDLNIGYIDEAGNENGSVDYGESVEPTAFTIDRLAPTGSVTAAAAEGKTETWNSLINDIRFAIWSNKKIDIQGKLEDATSGLAAVQYHKAAKPVSDLSQAAWTAFDTDKGLAITEDQQFIIYLKITDNAGHVTYISTDGLIVDSKAPAVEHIKPEVTIEPVQPVNDIYRGDVDVDIKVSDVAPGSGLKKVSYEVLDLGEVTQSGTLYTFDKTKPNQSELKQTFASRITVNSKKNNSNDIKVIVYGEDNAGNTVKKEKSIKIDTTRPTIEVSYSNNKVQKSRYFKAGRTATIKITERNFVADDVKITMTNTDGKVPSVSKWKKVKGSGNLDNTTWEATISYVADGDYTFGISYTDKAGNKNRAVAYGDSKAPTKFTIDKVKPKVSVSYHNNRAQNGKYYNAPRTATVVITEHNLSPNGADKDRVKVKMTATNGSARAAVPAVSSWNRKGDRHTATIYYSGNARYTFDITVTDKAGNTYDRFKEQEFYVDKVNPTIEFSGVEENSANSGDVIPVVSFNDINYDPDRMELTLTGAQNGNVTPNGGYSDVGNGRVFTFRNFEKVKEVDDIYTLTATMWDKAGNTISEDITFSVNRFGSVYTLSDGSRRINGKYIQEAKDMVITETNVNSLRNTSVTLFKNGEAVQLERGTDYAVDAAGGGGSWHRYTYTIFKKNFEDDGVYRVAIYSEDEAGNVSENTLDTKNTNVSFGVDKTAPNVVVTNVENGTAYDYESYVAKITANDNLVLTSVAVYLDDYEKPVATWTEKDIASIQKQGEVFTLTIPESSAARKMKVVCVDAAGNEKKEEIKNFYVTTNAFVQFYSNKPLFFGTVGGVLALGGLISYAIGKRRRKSQPEK